MMILYCTTLLHTCLSTTSSLLRCPLVLLSCMLVVACCVASIACIFAAHSFLADCCVHPPLLPPPAAVTKKSLRHCTPHHKCIMSSTPLLLSTLLSFRCAGWLLYNTLPLLLQASLPLLCPCQRPCCTGIITVVALASLPSLPPTLPLSIAAVKQIFAADPSFG
jgi:hypothetical protein